MFYLCYDKYEEVPSLDNDLENDTVRRLILDTNMKIECSKHYGCVWIILGTLFSSTRNDYIQHQ